MVDGEWGGAGLTCAHGLIRNAAAARCLKIDVFQSFRALPILRSNFEHNIILIQLGIDDGYFRLTERVVQSRVQRLCGKAELGRSDAIIVQQHVEAAILLIGADVLKAVEVLHLIGYDRSPLGKTTHRVGLQRVLVHRIAGAAPDTQILNRLKKRRGHGQTVQLRAEAVDDLRSGHLALLQRLERNEERTGIGGAAAPGERNHIGDGRIVLDYRTDLPNGRIHLREGCILRPAYGAGDRSRILHREKAFGYLDDQYYIERYGDEQYDEGGYGMFQHPAQAAAVQRQHTVEKLFAGHVEAAMFFLALAFQKVGAHHRRRGQRDDHRYKDGRRESNSKLAKE